MAIYWVMFALPLIGATMRMTTFRRLDQAYWWVTGLVFVIIVGLRYEMGWDWFNYLGLYQSVEGLNLWDAMGTTDPGYAAVEWIGVQLHLGFWFVNLICAGVFLFGLFTFARRQPDPWLALLISVPYAIIVMGMGYTRQSAAVGMEFLAVLAIMDRRVFMFAGCVLGAALFHKSAIALLPLALLFGTDRPILRFVAGLSLAMAVYALVDRLDQYLSFRALYIDQALASEGTGPRLAVNTVAAAGFLFVRRYIPARPNERLLMTAFALASIVCIPLAFAFSTATDRLVLFLLPIQLFFWGRIETMFSNRVLSTPLRLGGVAFYGVIQFVWLNYAIHASAWIPYRSVIIG